MAYRNRTLPPERKRKGRPILTIKRPSETAQPASIERHEDTTNAAGTQLFEASLWRARNEWSIRKNRRGLFGQLTKDAAARALKVALDELNEGVAA